MTTSADENSALKRNSVHQTKLSLELQQLEKDRSIRLREMQKASQVFARRKEQIQGVREKASLRRVTSAPLKKDLENNSVRLRSTPSRESPDYSSPFVTTAPKLQSEPQKRKLQKTMTMPSLTTLSSSSSPTQFLSSSGVHPKSSSPLHRRRSLTLLEDTPANGTRIPIYSRNFCDLRGQRRNAQPTNSTNKF